MALTWISTITQNVSETRPANCPTDRIVVGLMTMRAELGRTIKSTGCLGAATRSRAPTDDAAASWVAGALLAGYAHLVYTGTIERR
jgi:hypothetical protein